MDYGLWLFASIVCIGLIAGLYPRLFPGQVQPRVYLGGIHPKWSHGRFPEKNAGHFPIRALHRSPYHHAYIAQSVGLYEESGRGV